MTIQFVRLISTIQCSEDVPPRLLVEQFSLSAENARLRSTVEALSATVVHLTWRMVIAWAAGVVMGIAGAVGWMWATGGLKL